MGRLLQRSRPEAVVLRAEGAGAAGARVCRGKRGRKTAWTPHPAVAWALEKWWEHYPCWVGSSWPIFSVGHQYSAHSHGPQGSLAIQEEQIRRPDCRVGAAETQV